MGKINETVINALEILQQYCDETGALPRATTDLSPLEEWLLIQLIKTKE